MVHIGPARAGLTVNLAFTVMCQEIGSTYCGPECSGGEHGRANKQSSQEEDVVVRAPSIEEWRGSMGCPQ